MYCIEGYGGGRCTVYRTTEGEGVLYIGLRRRKVYCIQDYGGEGVLYTGLRRGRYTVYRTTEEEGVMYIGLRRRKVYCI